MPERAPALPREVEDSPPARHRRRRGTVRRTSGPRGPSRRRGEAGRSPGAPRPQATYGWVDGEAKTEFVDIVGVARGKDGMIAVADRRLGLVGIFAADGGFVAAMGRPGQGPGEFGMLSTLVGDPERGRLFTFDRTH